LRFVKGAFLKEKRQKRGVLPFDKAKKHSMIIRGGRVAIALLFLDNARRDFALANTEVFLRSSFELQKRSFQD
jgi:hypothetical protein